VQPADAKDEPLLLALSIHKLIRNAVWR